MPANTAEYLYEIAKQLPASERIRLVEKIAHGLASPPEPASEPEVAARLTDGLSTRLHLVGQQRRQWVRAWRARQAQAPPLVLP